MSTKPVRIHFHCENDVLVVAPSGMLGELDYEECQTDLDDVLKLAESQHVRAIVLDLGGIELFGSSAVGWFIELSHRVAAHGGRLVMCHLSSLGKEVLRASKLDRHWTLFETRDQALAALGVEGG
jgi:stage II sporulation protein AA (anti-sigma F factor antagonist)